MVIYETRVLSFRCIIDSLVHTQLFGHDNILSRGVGHHIEANTQAREGKEEDEINVVHVSKITPKTILPLPLLTRAPDYTRLYSVRHCCATSGSASVSPHAQQRTHHTLTFLLWSHPGLTELG